MTKKEYTLIMDYFKLVKNASREELEKLLDFENLTMETNTASQISKILERLPESDPERTIKDFVRFVRERSRSGAIQWDEFMSRLKGLKLENSFFGIRVRRSSKLVSWEVFFNHFRTTDNDDGVVKLMFDLEYYGDAEVKNAFELLSGHGINTDSKVSSIMSQVAEKWDGLSVAERSGMISALYAIYAIHYTTKSRVEIISNEVKKISMSKADLYLGSGKREYSLEFTDGSCIDLKF